MMHRTGGQAQPVPLFRRPLPVFKLMDRAVAPARFVSHLLLAPLQFGKDGVNRS